MLAIRQEGKALVLVLHEIYGINDHVKAMAASFAEQNFDVVVPDFIGRSEPFSYEQSEEAYQNFIETIGFDSAVKQVEKLLAEVARNYEEIHVVGFSIGATVAWLCSQLDSITSVTGFYGSRIRDCLDNMPLCPVLLIYGDYEKSFDVTKFISKIASDSVEAVCLPGAHGFADSYAPMFHLDSHQKAMDLMDNFQKRHSAILN